MVDISVIIPVYNSERYLGNTIKSVLNQTKKEFELILIDDGSTDNSGEICDYYANVNPRIKVIHKNNEGHCKARNDGLNLSKGRYIVFLDNDDLIEKELLEDNYKIMEASKADIVKFGKDEITCEGEKIIKHQYYTYDDVNKLNLKENLIDFIYSGVFRNIWDGMYRKEILENFSLDFMGTGGEDEFLNFQMINKKPNLIFNNKVYYQHFFRKGISTSSKYKENVFYVLKKNLNMFIEISSKKIYKTNIEKYNLIQVNNYLKPYVANLTKKECNKSYIAKRKELKEMGLDLRWCNLLKMFKLMKLETIIFILYKLKFYNILLFLPKLKWKGRKK